ncbi:MAG: PorP/SprF family type IX secretion system membrane protein [Bacteroidota bacterium]
MKRFSFFIFLFSALTTKAQDFAFSQFYEMPMLRNPALSGIFNGDLHVSSAYRSQWGSISVPYITSALGIEYKLPVAEQSNSFYTIGLQLAYDKAGDLNLKRTQVLPVVTYHQSLSGNSDTYLSGSIMFGKVLSRFDPTGAMTDDQFVNGAYSPSNVSGQSFTNTSSSYTDVSAGLMYSSVFGEDSHYYIGAALFHLNRPRLNFFSSGDDVPLASKIVFNAGLSTPLNDRDQLIAYVDYYQQAGNKQLFGGLLYESTLMVYDDDNDNIKVSAGGFYRWNDALIPTLKLQMRRMMLGISYDVNVSQLRTASQLRGGLEITLSFLGFLNQSNSSRNRVRCPGFGRTSQIGWFSTN